MKKVLLVLLFIPLMSIGQNIATKIYKTVDNARTLKWNTNTNVILDTINITEIKDEFIQVKLFVKKENAFSTGQHLLITSGNKSIPLGATYKYKYWNVYDGDKLIPLKDEIDVLNFFSKYGFEYMKTSVENSGGSNTIYMPNIKQSFTSSAKSTSTLTFKNNNN